MFFYFGTKYGNLWEIPYKNSIFTVNVGICGTEKRGVFRTLSNIYDGALLQKLLRELLAVPDLKCLSCCRGSKNYKYL